MPDFFSTVNNTFDSSYLLTHLFIEYRLHILFLLSRISMPLFFSNKFSQPAIINIHWTMGFSQNSTRCSHPSVEPFSTGDGRGAKTRLFQLPVPPGQARERLLLDPSSRSSAPPLLEESGNDKSSISRTRSVKAFDTSTDLLSSFSKISHGNFSLDRKESQENFWKKIRGAKRVEIAPAKICKYLPLLYYLI